MFVCEKDYSCCGFRYWDRWEDVEQDAKECGHLIEVAPVVHGEWINLTECANEGVYCSVCHKKVYRADYAWCVKKNKVRSNFCPNCGADMRERKDDNEN